MQWDIKAAHRDLLKAMAVWTAAATLAGCSNNSWLRQLAQSQFSGRGSTESERSASVGTVSREDRSPDARGWSPFFGNSASRLPQRSYPIMHISSAGIMRVTHQHRPAYVSALVSRRFNSPSAALESK